MKELEKFVNEYVKETDSLLSSKEIIAQMHLIPLLDSGSKQPVGFVGCSFEKRDKGKAAILECVYMQPDRRGKFLFAVLPNLLKELRNMGYDYVQSLVKPDLIRWITRRYKPRHLGNTYVLDLKEV